MAKATVLNKAFEFGNQEVLLSPTACGVIGVICFILATAAGAFIRIPLPFTPVPITLQTFFVLLAGAVLGKKLGILSQAGYVILGLFGAPIFAGAHAGAAYFMGPTGGYILGFALASWAVGKIMGMKYNPGSSWTMISMISGAVVYFSLGALWLSVVLHVSIAKAVMLGVIPFIPGDIVKILSAAALYNLVHVRVREIYPLN